MLKSTSIAVACLATYSALMLVFATGLRSDIIFGVWAMSLVLYGMYGMTAYFADDRADLFTTTGMVLGLALIAAVIAAWIYAMVVL